MQLIQLVKCTMMFPSYLSSYIPRVDIKKEVRSSFICRCCDKRLNIWYTYKPSVQFFMIEPAPITAESSHFNLH